MTILLASSVRRRRTGFSVVELMVSVLVMTFASTAIFSLLISTADMSQKVSNKMDSVNACRNVMERLSKDVRMGRALGDVYGSNVELWTDTVTGQPVLGFQGSDAFPANRNPCYGSGQTPIGGWPWTGPPYQLNNTTMIVQTPIFGASGYPTSVPSGSGNPALPSAQDNVETHIYKVIPDPDQLRNPGQFILQMSKIAGFPTAGYNPAVISSAPQTILTGIVGPMDSQGQPKIFQYLDKTDASGTPQDTFADPGTVANCTGVIVNLEVMKQLEGARRPAALGLKTEVFLRNNALSTTVGTAAEESNEP